MILVVLSDKKQFLNDTPRGTYEILNRNFTEVVLLVREEVVLLVRKEVVLLVWQEVGKRRIVTDLLVHGGEEAVVGTGGGVVVHVPHGGRL